MEAIPETAKHLLFYVLFLQMVNFCFLKFPISKGGTSTFIISCMFRHFPITT